MTATQSSSTKQSTIAVFGSTGSIGTATLEVVEQLGSYDVFALTAHSSHEQLHEQVLKFQPRRAVLSCGASAEKSGWPSKIAATDCYSGPDEIAKIASSPEVDVVVAAIVGGAGVYGALAAAESGKRIALANKESLVVAGPLIMEAARKSHAAILPVDSEHSAIFQSLQRHRMGRRDSSASGESKNENSQGQTQPSELTSLTTFADYGDSVERIILTTSGGSLRDWELDKLETATVDDALAHPTWNMGRKITIDSATMMNKAFEVIEARWLFDIPFDQISVVVHPQSIIHSMVEFVDGSVISQMSPPDMRLPIQYALTYPNRLPSPAERMNWEKPISLDLKPVDVERYPAIELGFEVAKLGGTSGSALNAANEVAVDLFLSNKIKFTDIARLNRAVLNNHNFDASPSLEQLLDIDSWARREAQAWAIQSKR